MNWLYLICVYCAMYVHMKVVHMYVATLCESRLTVVSREAKKKQAVRDERVSYLHVALL